MNDTNTKVTQEVDNSATDPIPTALTVMTEEKFNFREPSAKALAANPQVKKRETVVLKLPYLTTSGLITALVGNDVEAALTIHQAINQLTGDSPKILEYIVNIVNGSVYEAAKDQVNDETNPVSTQDKLNLDELTLEYLANQTRERKSSGISKEDWEAFKESFNTTMPLITGRDPEKVKLACRHMMNRFAKVQTSKKVLEILKPMISVWYIALKTPEEQERFAPIAKYLSDKIDEYMNVTEDSMLAELM